MTVTASMAVYNGLSFLFHREKNKEMASSLTGWSLHCCCCGCFEQHDLTWQVRSCVPLTMLAALLPVVA